MSAAPAHANGADSAVDPSGADASTDASNTSDSRGTGPTGFGANAAEVSGGSDSSGAGLAGSGGSRGAAAADGSSRHTESDPTRADLGISPATPADPALRPATEADLDEIWAIEAAVFGRDAWSRDLMRDELTGEHRVYLALTGGDGVVVGYAGLLALGAEGDVQTIAVAPALRGQGQGRRLMNALLDEAAARGVRTVFLEVRADNPAARGLYASLGFAEIGVRPRYYQPDNVDAIVMQLEMRERR